MMNKIFNTYIKKFQFFPKSSIYDSNAKHRISEFNRHQATLYFIVKTQKVRFIPETFKATANYCFQGQLEVLNKRHNIIFNIAKILYSHEKLKDRFSSVNEFTEWCMNLWGDPQRQNLRNEDKYALLSSVNLLKSNDSELTIDCKLHHSLTGGENSEFTTYPYQLINFFDIDCLGPLEIIYIGKSNDDTWDRIYNHNKWGPIDEYCSEAEEILVYFLEIEKSTININRQQNLQIIERRKSDIDIVSATIATEAALIKYFIKHKKFNEKLVGTDIRNMDVVRNVFIKNGYTDINSEVCLTGLFGNLRSADINSDKYHKANYSFIYPNR
jgi:hypothetical protein